MAKKLSKKSDREVLQNLTEKGSPKFSLLSKIKKSPYYDKSARSTVDQRARMILESELKDHNSKILPGQLIMFDYFEPKTKEELLYYDRKPTTIFFNVIETKQGKRVLGFNIHYYPPKIRYRVMNTIMNIYKPIYTKYFTEGPQTSMDAFDYRYLMDSLENAKLDFGVRMYDPKLIRNVTHIPPKYWEIAVFTQGWFMKRSLNAIMRYWENWKS